MEPTSGKQSVVSRLFGFGRRRPPKEEADPVVPPPPPRPQEEGFARTDAEPEASDGPEVTIPEQVIRIRTKPISKRDDVVQAIGESFRELTTMLGSVSERLDRQDSRTSDLTDQLGELPEYLRTLPRLQQEHNEVLRELGDRVAQGAEAVGGVADALRRIPEELREGSKGQADAIRKVALSQQQMAKAVYAGNQKSLKLFHEATQKTLQNVQRQARLQQEALRAQQEDMQEVLAVSAANMKRTFLLAAAFMAAALIAVVGLLLLR